DLNEDPEDTSLRSIKFGAIYFFLEEDLFLPLLADFLEADFFDALFLGALFLDAPFFLGTFAPLSLASESPMAIACFLLVTFLPERPDFNCPRFLSCIAFSTLSCAPFEYLAIVVVFMLLLSDGNF